MKRSYEEVKRRKQKKIVGGTWGKGQQEGQRIITEYGLVMSVGTMYILSFGSIVFSWAKTQHLGYIT